MPPPVVLWSNALGILPEAFHLRASHPQGCKRSYISPVYARMGTSNASPEIYPNGSCRGIDVECHLLPCSVCQYLTPACGWPPVPASEPPWPPRGLHYVGGLSLRTGSRIPFGSWAVKRPQQPPFGPPPTWQCLLIFLGSSSGKTGCLCWPLPSVQACRAAGQVAFRVSILCGRGPKSPSGRFSTAQAGQWVHLPLGLALADKPLHFFPPHLGGMHKHPLGNDGAVQSSNLPLQVLIQK